MEDTSKCHSYCFRFKSRKFTYLFFLYIFFETDNRPNSSAIPSGAIIGGLFGSLFLITVCSDIVCRCLGIRKPSQGRVRTCNPTEGNPGKYKNATRKLQMLQAFSAICQVPCV